MSQSESWGWQRLGILGSDLGGIHWLKEFKWANSWLGAGRRGGEQEREKYREQTSAYRVFSDDMG